MREGSREAVAGHPSGAEARLFVESFGTAEAVPFQNHLQENYFYPLCLMCITSPSCTM